MLARGINQLYYHFMDIHTYKSAFQPDINILWDGSPLWGHLVLNAVIQMGLSYDIITAKELCLYGIGAKILIVPGGSSKLKLKSLGDKGMAVVQSFVREGGIYLGFCGGAGLGLRGKLGFCPWDRNCYASRMQHQVSGHVECSIVSDTLTGSARKVSLPVWWPGRFQESSSDVGVRVLARYESAGKDLFIGDIPLQILPSTTFDDWKNLYGVSLYPTLLDDQPAIVAGTYGKGQYVLSYSHLETPESPDANALLGNILRQYLGNTETNKVDDAMIESWGRGSNMTCPQDFSVKWLVVSANKEWAVLAELYAQVEKLFQFGTELSLLFPRYSWLYGWHTSMPGAQLNALKVSLLRSLSLPSIPSRKVFMEKNIKEFAQNMSIFINGAQSWFTAKRLSESFSIMEALPQEILEAQRNELFGYQMHGGGLCGTLLKWLDAFLLLPKNTKM